MGRKGIVKFESATSNEKAEVHTYKTFKNQEIGYYKNNYYYLEANLKA